VVNSLLPAPSWGWEQLGAGRRELKELEKTTIDKRIF